MLYPPILDARALGFRPDPPQEAQGPSITNLMTSSLIFLLSWDMSLFRYSL